MPRYQVTMTFDVGDPETVARFSVQTEARDMTAAIDKIVNTTCGNPDGLQISNLVQVTATLDPPGVKRNLLSTP